MLFKVTENSFEWKEINVIKLKPLLSCFGIQELCSGLKHAVDPKKVDFWGDTAINMAKGNKPILEILRDISFTGANFLNQNMQFIDLLT